MSELATTIARHPLLVLGGLLTLALSITTVALRFLDVAPAERRTSRLTKVSSLVVVLAAASFWLMATGLDSSARTVAFDDALATALAQSPSPGLATVLATLTHLADRATLIGLVIVVGVVLLAARKRLLALAWVLTCIGNGLLNPALKEVFQRARPVHDAAFATVGQYSFPSGHTSGAVVVYGMLGYVAMRLATPRWRLPIALLAVAAMVTIGCSRVVLRVHWASDVVAGFSSGAAWLALCILVLERRRTSRA